MGQSNKSLNRKPLIGRLVVHGQPGDAKLGEKMLLDVLTKQWRNTLKIKFLITPGGFVVGDFPKNWSGGISWESTPSDFKVLQKQALSVLSRTVTNRVLKAAKKKVDVITIGIDLISDNLYEHAELVAMYDIVNRRIFWTGKSYPTSSQERDLVQIVDLRTHLRRIMGERVLILGCHDLNMFSPRGRANQKRGGFRWKRCKEMREIAHRFTPTIVLHHPHSTDTANIWRTAWGGITDEFENLRGWASGIGYHRWGKRPRATLDKVLAGTQGGVPVIDFVVKTK